MATFRTFEEILAWKKARELTRVVYALTKKERFSKDFALRDQIRRASVSIMSNIAEGFDRSGTREFLQFLAIAKGSTGEVRSQLYVANDQDYITQEELKSARTLAFELGNLIGGLMNYLRSSGLKGTKFKDN
jgi:four helix bundle protein